MPSLHVWPVIFALRLNELVIALAALKSLISPLASKASSSLDYCNKIPDIVELLSPYSIKLYICITTSVLWASSTCILFALLMQLING